VKVNQTKGGRRQFLRPKEKVGKGGGCIGAGKGGGQGGGGGGGGMTRQKFGEEDDEIPVSVGGEED